MDSHDITADDGTRLNLWERSPPDPDAAVVFLHGALTCSRALFAPPVPGDDSYSWLHAAAEERAAFALDVRGYGDSERPPEFDEPPEANDPPVRASDAKQDVRAAYEYVADRHETVHLVGVSWGTMTGGVFASENDPDLASLTQCAPVYLPAYEFEAGLAALGLEPDLDAYVVETRAAVEDRKGEEDDEELFEAVWRTQVESGQGIDGEDAYVAQTGAFADVQDACDGTPPYDASEIDVPTLVVRGSADVISSREDATRLYDDLEVAGDRAAYTELDGGDHYVMHGSRRRALYDVVSSFHARAERLQ